MRRLSRQALRSAAAHQQAQSEGLARGRGGAEVPSATSGDGVDAVPPFQQQGSRRRPSRYAGISNPRSQGGLQLLIFTLRVLGSRGAPSLRRVARFRQQSSWKSLVQQGPSAAVTGMPGAGGPPMLDTSLWKQCHNFQSQNFGSTPTCSSCST